MKRLKTIIWGFALIAVGVIFALDSTGIAEIKGWAAYLLIIPGLVGVFTEKKKSLSIIALLGGLLILLRAYGVIDTAMFMKLILPGAIVIVGAMLVFRGVRADRFAKRRGRIMALGGQLESYDAFFRKTNAVCIEGFKGAEINSVFGGTKIDLTDAIIDGDCVIKASAIFGHVEIVLPETVRLDERSTALFGIVSDKTVKQEDDDLPIVFVDSVCMFGGVEIR